ncbi:MAG: hypothetical protein JNK70_07865 [Phycisphaerae bacterium]|nr:hypothetical protein [Phycisphaerae bacterium]
MRTTRTLILIGLRGSGKSTVGRLAADRLQGTFVDLDDVTPGILGRGTVAEAWRLDGQAAFRTAEAAALRRVIEDPPDVLALGGGTPTAPGAADLLTQARGSGSVGVVYLRAGARELRRRLESAGSGAESGPGSNRPSLTGRPPLDEIEDVLAARDPIYLSLADVVIESSGLTVSACADAVVEAARPGGNFP